MDGEVEISTIKLVKHLIGDIYYPENSFYNCFPLPDEWMELFRNAGAKFSTIKEESFQENSLFYEPSLSVGNIMSALSIKNGTFNLAKDLEKGLASLKYSSLSKPNYYEKRRPASSFIRSMPCLEIPSIRSSTNKSRRDATPQRLETDTNEKLDIEISKIESPSKWDRPKTARSSTIMQILAEPIISPKFEQIDEVKLKKSRKHRKKRKATSVLKLDKEIMSEMNNQKMVPILKKVPKYIVRMKSPYGDAIQMTKNLLAVRVPKKLKRVSSNPQFVSI